MHADYLMKLALYKSHTYVLS